MTDLSHLRLRDTASEIRYTYAGGGGSVEFKTPPRDRIPHAHKLLGDFERAVTEFEERKAEAEEESEGLTLALRSDPGHPLRLDSLDRPRSGIELLSVSEEGGAVVATVFVPQSKIAIFLNLLRAYEERNTQTGQPRNKMLVESIASARLAVTKDFWCDPPPFPNPQEQLMWEVWLRAGDGEPEALHARFVEDCSAAGLQPNARYIRFPDRVVTLAFGSSEQFASSLGLLTSIAELRRAKVLASDYLRHPPRMQREAVDDLVRRVTFAGEAAPAVCILDTGVRAGHPLLANAIAPGDVHAVDPAWGTADHDEGQHGTGMAGMALYGCLTHVLPGDDPVVLHHRIESVKILPQPPAANQPEVYGYITEQGVSRAIIAAPARNRVICMAVTTDDRDKGKPSSWSGALDQMCSGVADDIPKLMFVSAGNVHNIRDSQVPYAYPDTNINVAGVEDPGQAWNVITVGAHTEKVFIQDPDFQGWHPIADVGDLCPSSRTSLAWGEQSFAGWPIKPEIVMEGGNYATDGVNRDAPEDLSLLTTRMGNDGSLFQGTGDTSPATADASRLAATLWSHYPTLWPETIRALLVHSARWTDAMRGRFPGNSKEAVRRRLRCFGFGVPDLARARYSAENVVTMVFEGEIQPFELDGRTPRTNVMHLHQLPWPVDVLESMGDARVGMRVTLSYFVEPSPGRRGWTRSHRYQSHGLRFDVKRPLESDAAFRRRLTRTAWELGLRPENVDETRDWVVGSQGRTNGSIHGDWWEGLASDLAACGQIAVYPVTGWWKERPHKGRVESNTRYSLVVSIEAPEQQVDLYAAIASEVEVETLIEAE